MCATVCAGIGGCVVNEIEAYRLLTLRAALKLEVATGLQRSRRGRATSTIVTEVMADHGWRPVPRRKAALLRTFEDMLREIGVLGNEQAGEDVHAAGRPGV